MKTFSIGPEENRYLDRLRYSSLFVVATSLKAAATRGSAVVTITPKELLHRAWTRLHKHRCIRVTLLQLWQLLV